jgi:hypothetical protein
VTLVVIVFHPLEPGIDLADAEAEFSADPEASRTPPLAAQVVDGLGIDVQVGAQLGKGQNLLDHPQRGTVRISSRVVLASMTSR